MGNSPSAIAENYVSSHTQVVQSVLNSTNQQCYGNCHNLNNTTICLSDIEGPVEIDLTVKQSCDIDTNCVVNAQTNNCLSSALSQTVQQNAEAIAKGLGGGDTVSSNITYLLTQYTQQIYNIYTQSCMASSIQENNTTVCIAGATEGVKITENVEQTATFSIDCALQSSSVSTAENEITQYISQVATAKTTGALSPAVIIVIIICITVILAVTVKKLKPGMIIFLFILFSLFGVGLYFLIAWITGTGIFYEEVCKVPNLDVEECIYPVQAKSLTVGTYANGAEVLITNVDRYQCGTLGSYTGSNIDYSTGTGVNDFFGGCRIDIDEYDGTNEQYLVCADLGYEYDGVHRACFCFDGGVITVPHNEAGNIFSNPEDLCTCKYGIDPKDSTRCNAAPKGTETGNCECAF